MPLTGSDIVGQLLNDFATAVTLSSVLESRDVAAVVDYNPAPVSGLDLGQPSPPCQLTVAADAAANVTAEWEAFVDGVTRPVLNVFPLGGDMASIWLGDPQ